MVLDNQFGNIIFNGVDLSLNNIFVQHYPLMGAPLRRQTAISGVAHRNAVFDEKEYDNIEVELSFVIVANTFEELSDRRSILFKTLDVSGYVPVKIAPDPFVYYMYRTSDMKETLFDSNPSNWIRVITVTFSRDPFKYYDGNEYDGGRNYVLGTKNALSWAGTGANNQSSDDSQPNNWYAMNRTALSHSVMISYNLTIDSDMPSTASIGLQFYGYPNWTQFLISGAHNSGTYKFSQSYSMPSDIQPTKDFMVRGIANGYTGNISISNVKIEIGNIATDWTPAPEDDIVITTSGTTINNPGNYNSLPKITIYANTGTGTSNVTINGVIQLKNVSGNIVLDSMLKDAYWIDSGGKYVNGNASMIKPYFPELQPKLNTITFDSTVSKIVITPRWRTL